MVKAILTDCFGVLVCKCGSSIISRYVKDPKKVEQLVQDYFTPGNLGEKRLDDILLEMSKDFHVDFASLKKDYFDMPKLHQKYIDELYSLKDRGYQIVLLSDTSDHIVESIIARFNLAPLFDKVYLSYKTRLIKSDPEAFLNVIHHDSYLPEEYLFLDDSPSNVAMAKSVGMNAILFTEKDEVVPKMESLLG